MEDVDDVAASFLDALGPMEAKKLQKLVYYAQAWSAAFRGKRLFANDIQAWAQGPVVPYLYSKHRQQWMVDRWPSGDPAHLSPVARDIVCWVIDRYGEFTGAELSEMTHAETPWLVARGDLPDRAWSQAPISVDLMAKYYANQVLSPERAVRHAVGNAALEGLSVPKGFDAVLTQVARGDRTAADVVAELVESFTSQA
jgi:uncharacterized phage-associated protein